MVDRQTDGWTEEILIQLVEVSTCILQLL